MSCAICFGYAPSCPCCSVDTYEPETARCEYCYDYFDVQELVRFDGARACRECAEAMREEAEAETMLRQRFEFNSHELINFLI